MNHPYINTIEFENFTNHWTGCPNCYPRHDRYCPEGKRLHDLNNSSRTYPPISEQKETMPIVVPTIPPLSKGKRR